MNEVTQTPETTTPEEKLTELQKLVDQLVDRQKKDHAFMKMLVDILLSRQTSELSDNLKSAISTQWVLYERNRE